MKTLFISLLALFTLQAGASQLSEIEISEIELQEELNYSFEGMDEYSNKVAGLDAVNYWQSSSTSCSAGTICPNGRRIWCQTFGYNYSNVPSSMRNSCSWMVIPGRAVSCRGYSQQVDGWGRYFWSYVNVGDRCY